MVTGCGRENEKIKGVVIGSRLLGESHDMVYEIHLQSKRRDEMIDITVQVEKLLAQEAVQ